jgi:hypothetical protein
LEAIVVLLTHNICPLHPSLLPTLTPHNHIHRHTCIALGPQPFSSSFPCTFLSTTRALLSLGLLNTLENAYFNRTFFELSPPP